MVRWGTARYSLCAGRCVVISWLERCQTRSSSDKYLAILVLDKPGSGLVNLNALFAYVSLCLYDGTGCPRYKLVVVISLAPSNAPSLSEAQALVESSELREKM